MFQYLNTSSLGSSSVYQSYRPVKMESISTHTHKSIKTVQLPDNEYTVDIIYIVLQ
jgi:hypothetical protein